jgi:hypothetical protein
MTEILTMCFIKEKKKNSRQSLKKTKNPKFAYSKRTFTSPHLSPDSKKVPQKVVNVFVKGLSCCFEQKKSFSGFQKKKKNTSFGSQRCGYATKPLLITFFFNQQIFSFNHSVFF